MPTIQTQPTRTNKCPKDWKSIHRCYVLAELKKAEEAMKEPNAKWYSHEEAWKFIRGETDV
ncbi:MAG: hypothetical protein FWG87_12960 [Defluviitaleaceae bacterium]|nr:hypothetical protein [Defluviitaleaceae bacterium]